MSASGEARLWRVQRLTAVVLAVCVAVHLLTIIYAVRGGLTGADVLARTRGNVAVAIFYGVFVLAAAAHGAIGLRGIAIEWLRFGKGAAHAFMWTAALLLAVLGLYAVFALVRA